MEYELYKVFRQNGFVVSKRTLSACLIDTGKMELGTLQSLLSRSPIVVSQSVGVYALRGVTPRAAGPEDQFQSH